MKTRELDLIQSELLALSDLAVRRALQKGANEAEALSSKADMISVNIRKLTAEARCGTPSGVGIRVAVEGKVGFAAATGTDKRLIDAVVEEALAVARIRPADPNFKHLPDPVKLASEDGTIDSSITEFSEDDALASVSEFAKRALALDKRVKSFYGTLLVNRACFAVSSSRGIEASSKTSYIEASARCTTAEEGRQKTGTDSLVSRRLTDFSQIGESAAKNSLKMLGAKPLSQTFKSSVVWENVSIGELLKDTLGSATDAGNAMDGRSRYEGKVGEEVTSPDITAIDDGQLPEGIATSKVDGEGIPRRTTKIIDRGVLKTYIYNGYSSARQNRESTGNASRDWPEPFLQLPGTSITNLVVIPGAKRIDELAAEIGEGILVTDRPIGIGMSNLTTGEFSVVAPNAYLIAKGEITYPLEPVSIAGNILDALKKVQLVGQDVRLLSEGKIPSMVLDDLTVSG
ncbi:MAG: TldD/PmbA family protein [Promethearchaeati archaeon SRVP18_Atabeyarchaeia-1]